MLIFSGTLRAHLKEPREAQPFYAAGLAGSCERGDDADLYARDAKAGTWGAEPAGWVRDFLTTKYTKVGISGSDFIVPLCVCLHRPKGHPLQSPVTTFRATLQSMTHLRAPALRRGQKGSEVLAPRLGQRGSFL